jgi:hypothetical protein
LGDGTDACRRVVRPVDEEGLAVLAEYKGIGAGASIYVAKDCLDSRGVFGRGQPQTGRIESGIPDQLACAGGFDLD